MHPNIDVYARVIYFRPRGDDHLVLMQRLSDGLCIFPGGRYKDEDGDTIETLWRELCEETHLARRMWFVYDLIYESRMFLAWWDNYNLDVCYIVEWKDWLDLLPVLDLSEDDEDRATTEDVRWISLNSVVVGNRYRGVWYPNVLRACEIAHQRLQNWVNPLEEAVWETPTLTEDGRLVF